MVTIQGVPKVLSPKTQKSWFCAIQVPELRTSPQIPNLPVDTVSRSEDSPGGDQRTTTGEGTTGEQSNLVLGLAAHRISATNHTGNRAVDGLVQHPWMHLGALRRKWKSQWNFLGGEGSCRKAGQSENGELHGSLGACWCWFQVN